VRVEALELRRVSLPLVVPFRGALGTETVRDALLVRVVTDVGDGWGECVAMREPTYTPEYVDGAEHVIVHHLGPRLLAEDGVDAASLSTVLAPVKGHPMAKTALELAVLDAELRAADRSLASSLGAVRTRVEVGVAVGIPESIADLLAIVGDHIDRGYRRIKLKVEPGWDLAPVAAVREAFGPELRLQVDGNGSYRLDDAAHLAGLDGFGLLFIEQPLPDDDLDGHAELARRIATPVCLDESITSVRTALDAVERGACAVVNVKPGRVGGYREAVRIHDACVPRGIGLWVGGMLETGIGRAANLALAALPGFTFPADLSATDRYFRQDVTAPFVLADGHLDVPDGPGIGVDIDRAALASLTTSVKMVTGR
jgi:O-succinylbenzoate synthase